MTATLTRQPAPATTPATPAPHGRIRRACRAIRLAIQEMNYASRRLVELQAPWSVDNQRHGK